MEETKKFAEESTKKQLIQIELGEWLDMHLQKVSLEYERDDVRRKLWNEMSRVEQMKTEIKDLEKKLEDALDKIDELTAEDPNAFREINLIDIARKNAEVLEGEE